MIRWERLRLAVRWLLYLVQYLYFQRVPLVFLVLSWGISIGALRGNSEFAGGLETASARFIGFLAATTLFLSWLIVSAFLLIWRHGTARFGTRSLWHPFAGGGHLRFLPALVVAALPLCAIFLSRRTELKATIAGLAIVAAVVVVFGTLAFLDKLLGLARSPASGMAARLGLTRPVAWVSASARWLARLLGPGYWEPGDGGRIADGQARAVVGFVALLVLYVSVYLVWLTQPPVGQEPAGAFVLVFLSLLLSGAAGATFLLDRYRIPVLLTGLVLLVLLYGANGADHYFEVQVLPPSAGQVEPVRIAAAAASRLLATAESRAQDVRPLLVVATISGGGIQSAAWSGRVLTGLEEAVAADAVLAARGIRFLESVQLISSVSGGSVGALELLAAMQDHGPVGPWAAGELARVRRATAQSSLAALGWAFVYPEFLRVLVPGYDYRKDRGWALERAWSAALQRVLGVDRRLDRATWAREVSTGRLPGMVFNSTIVETGSPLFLTPLDTDIAAGLFPDFGLRQLLVDPNAEATGFLDIDMVQAARLSSNFPYVGPPTAPRCVSGPCPAFGAFHVVDGAYFDGHGVTAAMAWLRELRAARAFDIGAAFGGVAIVQVEAFPQRPRKSPVRTRWTGIYNELLGPAVAMLNMRSTSQTLRDAIEVQSLCTILQQGAEGEAVPCQHFVFQPPPDVRPPLSWHLRPHDVAEIQRSWEQIAQPGSAANESSLARLLSYMRTHSAPLTAGGEPGDADSAIVGAKPETEGGN